MEKTFFLTASSPVYLQLGFVFLLRFLVPVSIPCGLLYKSLTNTDQAFWVPFGRCCTGMDSAITAV